MPRLLPDGRGPRGGQDYAEWLLTRNQLANKPDYWDVTREATTSFVAQSSAVNLCRSPLSGAGLNVTMPPAASCQGKEVMIRDFGGGHINLVPSGADFIDTARSVNNLKFKTLSLVSDGIENWYTLHRTPRSFDMVRAYLSATQTTNLTAGNHIQYAQGTPSTSELIKMTAPGGVGQALGIFRLAPGHTYRIMAHAAFEWTAPGTTSAVTLFIYDNVAGTILTMDNGTSLGFTYPAANTANTFGPYQLLHGYYSTGVASRDIDFRIDSITGAAVLVGCSVASWMEISVVS